MPHAKRTRGPAKPRLQVDKSTSVRCFENRARLDGANYRTVSYEKAMHLLNQESARLVNNNKDIQMNGLKEIQTRDRSCAWRDRVVYLNAVGDYAVQQMTAMLDPRFGRIDRVRIVNA